MRKRLRGAVQTVATIYLNSYRFRFSDADGLKNFEDTVEFDGMDVLYAYRPKVDSKCSVEEAAAGSISCQN